MMIMIETGYDSMCGTRRLLSIVGDCRHVDLFLYPAATEERKEKKKKKKRKEGKRERKRKCSLLKPEHFGVYCSVCFFFF